MDYIKELVKMHIQPFLKSMGFKKGDLYWNKEYEELVYVINIQRSKFNDSSEQSFTINLGIYTEFVQMVLWEKPKPKIVKDTECVFRRRIGELLDEQKDTWWFLRRESEIDVIGNEVKNVLDKIVIPFLLRFKELSDIELAIEKQVGFRSSTDPLEKLMHAAIKYKLQKKDEAYTLIEDVKNTSWNDNARIVEQRLKLCSL